MRDTHLLIIDPQYDFCNPNGSLFVSGADEDMKRLAVFIESNKEKITKIHCTLDSHHHVSIERPVFWLDQNGGRPDPFTIITTKDVKSGIWRPQIFSLQEKVQNYVDKLEANSRYPLCIWPPHCEIGTLGATIVPEIIKALDSWAEKHFRTIGYVAKGSNPLTEHYSAVQADVPDPTDPGTQINTRLIDILASADEILLAGEASSHCLANTVTDIANNFSDERYINKFTLLEDATSPVGGFENLTDRFIKDMTAKGMKISTTEKWMQ